MLTMLQIRRKQDLALRRLTGAIQMVAVVVPDLPPSWGSRSLAPDHGGTVPQRGHDALIIKAGDLQEGFEGMWYRGIYGCRSMYGTGH